MTMSSASRRNNTSNNILQRRAIASSTSSSSIIKAANDNNANGSHRSSSSKIGLLHKLAILTPLLSLISLWIYATIYIISSNDDAITDSFSLRGIRNRTIKQQHRLIDLLRRKNTNTTTIDNTIQSPTLHNQQPILLISRRNTKNVLNITSSARGNLGPPTVINQNPPGNNWLKDRWQAASDMHGSAIPGTHWIMFQFANVFEVRKVVLDWETAYSNDYRVETRVDAPSSSSGSSSNSVVGANDDTWCVLYDTNDRKEVHQNELSNNNNHNHRIHIPQVTNEEYGQSPGVKDKLPLHIIHTIDWGSDDDISKESHDEQYHCHSMRYLRIFIRSSAMGWGVSLWQVDIYGRLSSN